VLDDKLRKALLDYWRALLLWAALSDISRRTLMKAIGRGPI
jgi:hypothetical protein